MTTRSSARHGFTLVELVVTIVILAIIGAAITKLYVSQARSYDLQTQMRKARYVSRTAVNAALSDLRMVENTGGMVSATSTQVVVRVPYAMGLVCANTGVLTTIALLPVDSVQYATAGFSGYAWRDSTGAYNYVEASVTLGVGVAATCTLAGVTVLTNGRVITVAPGMPVLYPAVTAVGTPVFLYQRLTYEFKASTVLPGRTSLWRTVNATSSAAELVGPFDATAKFRFYALNADTAQSAVPSPVSNIYGLELDLNGQSENAPEGKSSVRTTQLTTAVFFNNRIK
jgi:prepilin-type N-terminal cleavage/methylation domain-containing protein